MRRTALLALLCVLFLVPGQTSDICDDLNEIYQDGISNSLNIVSALEDAASVLDTEAIDFLVTELDLLGSELHTVLHAMDENDCE